MKKLKEVIKGITKTQKIVIATSVALIAIATLGTLATLYSVKQFKSKKLS